MLRLPPQNMAHATFMQPFQCDLQPQLQETNRTTHTGTTTRCKTHRRNQSRPERPQPHPPHTRGTFHRRLQPLYMEKRKVSCSGFLLTTWPMQHSCSHSNAICNHSFKKRIELRTQEQPLVAKHIEGTNRVRNDRSRTRRTHEVPFIACSHFTRKNTRFRAPASSPNQNMAHATFMQPFQCDLQPQLQETNRTTHTGTTTRCKTHRKNQSRPERPQPHPPHTRGTFHRRLQPLYMEKRKVSCSGFLLKTWPMQLSCSHSNAICNHSFKKRIELRTQEQPLVAKHIEGTNRVRNDRSRTRRTHEVPFIAACSHLTWKNTRFRAPASSLKHGPCNILAAISMHFAAFPSSPFPFVTTSVNHHFPSSPLPIVTTPLPHHFPTSPLPKVTTLPSSPLPFVTTSHRHHFPSSPLPLVTTSLRHHFPKSPLRIVTTSLPHHFPSSPLSIVTTSLPRHFPSSSLPKVTTLPSSPLPFVTTPHRHHFPSSPLPFVTTSLHHHFSKSPLPIVTTSLPHHFPSSPLPFVTTSLPHRFPSSPLPKVTTLP